MLFFTPVYTFSYILIFFYGITLIMGTTSSHSAAEERIRGAVGGFILLLLDYVKPLTQIIWKSIYEWFSHIAATDKQWQYTNYGFIPDNGEFVQLMKEDQYEEKCGSACIQLYHEVASAVSMEGKNVVEVGCGRGGGASYVARYLNPKTMTAIDVSSSSIEFANKLHKTKLPNLHFQVGDALNLPLPDNAYDIVINVESSHCYPSFSKFMSEVGRILRPGGYFAMCDLRNAAAFPRFEQDMINAGFVIETVVDITDNVLQSMKLYSPAREALFREIAGDVWYQRLELIFINFLGLVGSSVYAGLQTRSILYKRYVLQKKSD